MRENKLPCPFYISILSQQIYIDTPNIYTFGIVAEQTLEHGPSPLCLAKFEFKLAKAVDELHIWNGTWKKFLFYSSCYVPWYIKEITFISLRIYLLSGKIFVNCLKEHNFAFLNRIRPFPSSTCNEEKTQ